MVRIKYLLLIVALALASLVGIFAWRVSDSETSALAIKSQVRPENQASTPLVQKGATLPGVNSAVPAVSRVSQASEPSTSASLYEKYKTAVDLGDAYAEFSLLAQTNPEAQYFQAKILELCTVFQGPILQRLEERIEKSTPSKERKAALSVLKSGCKNVPAQISEISSGQMIQEASSRGDAKSQAYALRFEAIGIGEKSMADTNKVRELVLSRDPVVLNNIDGYFDARNNKLTWNIPGIDGTVSGSEMAHAFRLVACDFGYDCSATSVDARIACAYRGYCDGDRAAQIQNNLVSQNGFTRVQEIRKAILLAYSSGQWPDGIFSGSNGSMRKK